MKQPIPEFQDNREVGSSSNGDSHADADLVADTLRFADSLAAAEKATRKLAGSHYENFVVASFLLPKRLRQPFYNVYAFCRTADDLADNATDPEAAMAALNDFQHRLDDTFEGGPVEGLFLALRQTIEQFDLPRDPFDHLLDAFRQDQTTRSYADFPQLIDYCRRSANPVGRIVLRLAGCFDRSNAALSDEICTGLQLANFWQDVARDREIGRVYLPQDAMDRFDVKDPMLSESTTPQPLRDLLASECDRAEGFFRRGMPLAEQVPRWFSADIRLFAHGGLATLDAIRKIDFDVLAKRPTVSKWRQGVMVARAAVGLL